MDWTLLQPLMDWLAPAGWLVTAIAWWRDRKVYQVRAVKETEGTYKALYDDLSATVLELSKQLRKQNERNRPLGQPPNERNRANNLRAGPEEDGDLLGECGAVAEPE